MAKTPNEFFTECVVCNNLIYGARKGKEIRDRKNNLLTGRWVTWEGKEGFAHTPKCYVKATPSLEYDSKKLAAGDNDD